MDLGGKLILEQQQRLSQNQILSLSILAFDTLELKKFIKNEYLENPMLDCKDPNGTDTSVSTVTYQRNYKDLAQPEECGYDIPYQRKSGIKEYILDQLPRHTTEQDQRIAEYLIGCLEPNGFFTIPVTDIAVTLDVSEASVKKILDLLRELEPCGIFSENLSQCIHCQLVKAGDTDALLYEITDHYLESFLHGRISEITRNVKASTAEVRKRLERIAEMNPNPLYGFSEDTYGYIEPDILIKNGTNGKWSIELNDGWTENYGLNDYYLSLMQHIEDPELREYFKTKLDRVRFLMASIQHRRKTICSIMETILRLQEDYFENQGPLKPMTMGCVAELLSIHVSTVSRALRGKYIQYPKGIIEAKDLFETGLGRENAVAVSMVKEKIKALIEAENPKAPLSDSKLAEQLKKSGISVSRRAVTKYREQLSIPGSYDRKR